MGGHVAIVTGAASGIGRAIAEHLAREGDHRLVIVDRNAVDGRAAAGAVGGRFVQADLREVADCHRIIDETIAAFGTVHVLVNNAGFQHVAPLDEFPEDVWSSMLATMLTAPFLLTKYAWPAMKAQGWGRIVNISSVQGLVASPSKVGYIAAKHGLIGLTRASALEGAAHGITANAICPGATRTPLVQRQVEDLARDLGLATAEEGAQVLMAPAALKRLIEPGEIAGLVGYLASDAAAAVTGAAWAIDGGWTAR
jgi:3-hydroxybutyrate dehydrogenase